MVPAARRPSRVPVYVTVLGLAVALGLILYQLRDAPPPVVVIDRPGTEREPRAVNVILRDYLFQPTPLVLVPAETVRFTIINGGLEAHEFVLGDGAVQDAWEAADARSTPPIPLATAPPASVPVGVGGLRVLLASGEERTVDYAVPGAGEILLICHLPGHVEQGMTGRVELRSGGGQ